MDDLISRQGFSGIDTLYYAENGVHQCWSCQNRTGNGDAKLHMYDINSTPTTIRVVLPMCKHTNEYMLWVRSVPCEKYIPVIQGEGVDDE